MQFETAQSLLNIWRRFTYRTKLNKVYESNNDIVIIVNSSTVKIYLDPHHENTSTSEDTSDYHYLHKVQVQTEA